MNHLLLQFALRGVYAQYPWLPNHACGSCPSVEAEELALALDWFAQEGPPINLRRSAYALKRDVEDASGQHVGERAFAAAAVIAGYDLRLTKGNTIYLV